MTKDLALQVIHRLNRDFPDAAAFAVQYQTSAQDWGVVTPDLRTHSLVASLVAELTDKEYEGDCGFITL